MRIHMTGSEWFGTTRGGLNRYFTDLYEALASTDGVDVSAYAFGEPAVGGSTWGQPTGSTGARVRASMSPLPERGVIVDRHFALYGPPALGRRHGTRLVTHFHGPWAAESAMSGESSKSVRAKHLWERLRYNRSDLFVVLSNCFRDVLINDYRVDPTRIAVIPPGVDLTRFSRPATQLDDTGEHIGPPVVLCVRRLERRMGIDVLLRAWDSVRAEVPDAELVVIGTGGEDKALREQADAGGHPGSVTFVGNASDDELAAAYRRASITVVPTRALEGFGLIALESLAAGRAPIVTDVGGLPDSVRGFDDSLIVAPDDEQALGDRIVRALKGERPTANQCRSRAEEFTWNRCVSRHREVYSELNP
jgi:glycosyltransferase involved in cell wall biosynthesis